MISADVMMLLDARARSTSAQSKCALDGSLLLDREQPDLMSSPSSPAPAKDDATEGSASHRAEYASASWPPSLASRRTIRFYQSRGALMSPEIRGRVAYYGPAHAERLKLIAQLQDRGLRIDAIRDLLVSIDRGEARPS